MHELFGFGAITAGIYLTSTLAICAVFLLGHIPLEIDCEFSGVLRSLSLQRRL